MAAHILCIAGPTASGKSARAIHEALTHGGEVISVDSRQVYRGLDIGTEKIAREEMRGVPHHLIDIRDPREPYSAGDFARDAATLIADIASRGKLPILAGGTHFYFDALLGGLPEVPANLALRQAAETRTTEELYERVHQADPRRARELDPHNRRRLVRALEIIDAHGRVPERQTQGAAYDVNWIVINPETTELKERLAARLVQALERGLVDEVRRVCSEVGDERLNELGLEYRIVGEFVRGERTEASLLPTLSAKLWQYARRQKAWLAKLEREYTLTEAR